MTVSATETDKNAPTRFATAEMPTATLGFKAPVAIEVAIALPVSWNPLVKSKPRAVTTTSSKTNVSVLTLEVSPDRDWQLGGVSMIHIVFRLTPSS